MGVYWRIAKNGQNLIYSAEDDGPEERVGGYRETKRGIDAYAATFGYEPGRSQKGFETIEDAKAFVESFRPWELYGAEGVTVDSEVKPALDSASAGTPGTPPQPEDTVTPSQPAEIAAPDQPAEIAAPDQPAEIATPDQPAEIVTPDQPAEIVTPDQPAEIAAPDQPAEIVTPDQPAEIAAADQPAEIATPDQPAESRAPESQPSKRWWEFWKGS